MPQQRNLSQELITESKILMSARLVEIQNEILKRFQTSKEKQLVKKMFYRNLDQLPTLQQKISYLVMVLDEVDSSRLNKYMVSSYQNKDFIYPNDYEPQTDTSFQLIDEGDKRQNISKPLKNQILSPIKNQTLSPLKNKIDSDYPSSNLYNNINISKSNKLRSQNNHIPKSQQNNKYQQQQSRLSKYYAQANMGCEQPDQAIISRLYSSNQAHLYQDLIKQHRLRKSKAIISNADSMIENRKILQQLKKLQMEKKLLTYQHNHSITKFHQYSQTLTSPSLISSTIKNNDHQDINCNRGRLGRSKDINQNSKQSVSSQEIEDKRKGELLMDKLQNKYQTQNQNIIRPHHQDNNRQQDRIQSNNTKYLFKGDSDFNQSPKGKNSNFLAPNIDYIDESRLYDFIKEKDYQVKNSNSQKNQQLKNSSVNDLFSFRPNQENIVKQQGKSINHEKTGEQQIYSRSRAQVNKQNLKRRQLIEEEDEWVIQGLNRKLNQQDFLNYIKTNKNQPKHTNSNISHKGNVYLDENQFQSSPCQFDHSPKRDQYNQNHHNFYKNFESNNRLSLQQQLQYHENLLKLQKLQQQRFTHQKQTLFRNNPSTSQLSDRALRHKLKQFRSWLKYQSTTSLQTEPNQTFNNNQTKLPKFRFFNSQIDLNQADNPKYHDQDQDQHYQVNKQNYKNKRNPLYNYGNGDYICYSQSSIGGQAQKKQVSRDILQSKDKGKEIKSKDKDKDKGRINKQGNRMFKKKPQLTYNGTGLSNKLSEGKKTKYKQGKKCSKSHSKSNYNSKSRSKSNPKCKQLNKVNDKMKLIQQIYSPKSHKKPVNRSEQKPQSNSKPKYKELRNQKNINQNEQEDKLSAYLPTEDNYPRKQGNRKDYDSNDQGVDTQVDEMKIRGRLLKRVKSSPLMVMSGVPFSRDKQDLNILLRRYQLDQDRHKQLKHKIISQKQRINAESQFHPRDKQWCGTHSTHLRGTF